MRITATAPTVFGASTALIALHIVDAEFVQTRPGTSAADHLLAGLVPLAVAAAAAAAFPRLRPGLRAGLSLVFGILALLAGVIALGGGVSGSDVTGVLMLPAAIALIARGAWIPWRERGRGGWLGRGVAVVGGFLVALFFVFPVGAAMWTTQKYRTPIGTFSVPHQDAAFTTSDGLKLSGWYVPSKNGAAVLIVHGGGGDRDGARRHAAMLAHAGYGVLLYDARGRGRSQGDPDAYGWTWGPDVDAAATWLEHQPGVKRIGALGLSTGADVLVEEASHRRDIKAIVADGSTSRSTADTRHVVHGSDAVAVPFFWAQYAAASVLEDARPGPPLVKLAALVPPTPILFIASTWKVERDAAPLYARAAKASSSLWLVDAGHTAGLRVHPREYTKRVVGFFDRALLETS